MSALGRAPMTCDFTSPSTNRAIVGMLITLLFIPVSLSGALIGFFLFRVFDIIKPYPAARLEALHGGLGVMADDAMAAVYANLSLRAVLWLFPEWIR